MARRSRWLASACVALSVVLVTARPTHAQRAADADPPSAAADAGAPSGAQTQAAAQPPSQRSRGVENAVLATMSVASLALGPASIALLNDDLSFGESLEVSLVGSLGVVCAAGGTVLFIGGVGMLAISPILALLDDDAAGYVALIGAIAAGAGAGLFLVSPAVFSAAAEADGGFGDSTGEIAAVSSVSSIAAAFAAFGTTVLVIEWKPNVVIGAAAIFSVSFLAANVAYALTRAAIFDGDGEPAPTMGMLLPPMPF